jgi:hypothetical protein
MRLIDADELYEDLANNLSSIMGDGSDGEAIDTYVTIGDIIHDTFNAQPTAYDPDKVVEQLEEVEKIMTSPVNKDCFGEECRASDCTVCLISKAIEIVKGGGVDG